jgi:DNA invertase Pin-like site-specific DNA recombinase
MLDDGTPKAEIAKVLGFSRATLYRYINTHMVDQRRVVNVTADIDMSEAVDTRP